ncbi:unnamed protein product [Oikopleura dioica]|uniref:Uncharacterized protein n=1 Tax=Oikopleura dioica TaxID=34765 RepID=E4WW71_OIKDI|nr:unnamed protein product [Oikopleura dioica]
MIAYKIPRKNAKFTLHLMLALGQHLPRRVEARARDLRRHVTFFARDLRASFISSTITKRRFGGQLQRVIRPVFIAFWTSYCSSSPDTSERPCITAERRNRTKLDGNLPKRARSRFYREPVAEDFPELE